MTVLPGDRLRYGDIDEVARIAQEAVDVVRRGPKPGLVARFRFVALAWTRPGLVAQIVMALALWVDPDEPADERNARLREIARQKENAS